MGGTPRRQRTRKRSGAPSIGVNQHQQIIARDAAEVAHLQSHAIVVSPTIQPASWLHNDDTDHQDKRLRR